MLVVLLSPDLPKKTHRNIGKVIETSKNAHVVPIPGAWSLLQPHRPCPVRQHHRSDGQMPGRAVAAAGAATSGSLHLAVSAAAGASAATGAMFPGSRDGG